MLEVGRRNEAALAVIGDRDGETPGGHVVAAGGLQGDRHGHHDGDIEVDQPAQQGGEGQDRCRGQRAGRLVADQQAGQGAEEPEPAGRTEPAMIAARVANGPAVAQAAGGSASGWRQAAAAISTAAAVHSTTGSRSRGDVILADTSGLWA